MLTLKSLKIPQFFFILMRTMPLNMDTTLGLNIDASKLSIPVLITPIK